MDEKLLKALLLLNQSRRLREDLHGVDPEARARARGSGVTAFIGPFNALLSETREIVAEIPTISESVGEIEAQRELQERLDASYHWQVKYHMLVNLGALQAALETYLQLNLPPEEKQRVGFIR